MLSINASVSGFQTSPVSISIKVDNYKQTCKIYKEDTLILSIEAKENNKTTSYKIPLHLDDEC